MLRGRATSSHLLWGAFALGFAACATASSTTDTDSGTVPQVEAGADAAVVGETDAQPLVPDGSGTEDTGAEDASADVTTDAQPSDASIDALLDMNVPDTFDAGFCVTAPPSNVCGLDPQCGCGTGTCDIDRRTSTGATVCTTAGATPQGRACTGTSQCIQGETCESGACRPLCTTLNAACNKPGTGTCVQAYSQGVAVARFKVCEIECALHDPATCGGGGVGCIYDDATGGTDCFAVGTATTCSATSTTCGAGLVCVETGGGATFGCKRWCRVGTADCGGSVACSPFGTPVVVKGQEYGACL